MEKMKKGEISARSASQVLGVSIRQVKRIKVRYIKEGIIGLIHKNTGELSNRQISVEKEKEIIKLVDEKYYDFGPTFLSEKLEENEGIKVSKEGIRKIMIRNNKWQVKHRKINKEYRMFRIRKECYGEMIQYDGSYEKWFNKEEICLLAGIDDATGKIVKARFENNEGLVPSFKYLKEYIKEFGKPIALYVDKLSTYKMHIKSAQDNSELLSQFQRAMHELNINLIFANSPQSKGRLERLFGTLQDRLTKELRLKGITTDYKS